MVLLILFFFLLGTFLEPVPALILTVPIIGPIIGHLGFDPVHFGIVAIMMLVVGSVTPPVGISRWWRAGSPGSSTGTPWACCCPTP
jgi:C4-dicarboxylate transporter DctM subunit